MPVIAEDVIRSLVGFRGERAPVTSCYLDVDGRRYVRHQDLEHEVNVLLHDARSRANGDDSVRRDLHRIEELVKGGIDRSNTRGLGDLRVQRARSVGGDRASGVRCRTAW